MRTQNPFLPLLITLLCASLVAAAPAAKDKKQTKKDALTAAKTVIWRDPGNVEALDFVNGPGGAKMAPQPPLTFLKEETNGSSPKVEVRDAAGRRWTVKFGREGHAEVIASRLAWASGYFVEPNYFVRSGKVDGVTGAGSAKKYLSSDGTFENGRFELKEEMLAKFKDEESWTWTDNPFAGKRELNGLKILMMLTSNWDAKDRDDSGRGSNTAIHVVAGPNGREARYLVTDWGGTMGKWGGWPGHNKWDCDGYARQTPKFVKTVNGDGVEFGFSGTNGKLLKENIRVDDIAWLMQYLGRVTDQQIRAALEASGASADEVTCYAKAIRDRIEQLRRAAEGAKPVAVNRGSVR